MLGMPSPTPYDLNFRFLRIPVRVSPWFWLGMLMIGWSSQPGQVLLFVLCAFVSILIHEYGHGLVTRSFGYRAEIALFALGGLCASPDSHRETPSQRLAILAMGPGAQLILLVVLMVVGTTALGLAWSDYPALALWMIGFGADPVEVLLKLRPWEGGSLVGFVFLTLFWINWVWPLLILPIWPLDGGQMTHVLLTRANPRNGARWTHIVSMIVAGLLTFYVLRQFVDSANEGSMLRLFFFAWFVLINYQMLQAYQRRYEVYGPEDEADWWKR
jgi:stage IV sporulation protein FB